MVPLRVHEEPAGHGVQVAAVAPLRLYVPVLQGLGGVVAPEAQYIPEGQV